MMIYPDDPLPELPDPEVAALRARVLTLEQVLSQVQDVVNDLRQALVGQENA